MSDGHLATKTTRGPARLIVSLIVLVCIGCSGAGSGVNKVQRIDLEGLKYLSREQRVIDLSSVSGGLANLGDIDGDESDDILVASNSPRPGQSVGLGWIEAYSGATGQRIWQVSGMTNVEAQAAGFETGFRLNDAYLLTDVDGDQVPDVYAIEDNSKRVAFWISGKSGGIIGQFPIEGRDWWRQPAGVRFNENSQPQLVFLVNRLSNNPRQPAFEFVAASRLQMVGRQPVNWDDEPPGEIAVLSNSVPDQNGDGQMDWLVRKGLHQDFEAPVYQWGLAIFCGRQFELIREFKTDRPRIKKTEYWSVVHDIPSPGDVALVMSTGTGEGPQNRASSLRAISLDNGLVIWKVVGTNLTGGAESFTVDRAGNRSESIRDVEFGQAVVAAGDVNSDGVADMATTIRQPEGHVVIIFSGVDGEQIQTINAGRDNLKIGKSSPLIRINHGATASLVTTCTNKSTGGLELLVIQP